MRTILYVDGFNLYFRALKAHPEYRWLNLKLLAEEILNPENDLCAVKYCTARVSARTDPGGPRRQQIYLDALSTIPGMVIVQGNFLVTKTYATMVPHAPTNGKPVFKEWPAKVRIVKTEEKGSDVNLASHLIRDAFTDQFDVAVVITNDTDLIEPIRIVVQEVGRSVGKISPVDNAATGLNKVATFMRYDIWPVLNSRTLLSGRERMILSGPIREPKISGEPAVFGPNGSIAPHLCYTFSSFVAPTGEH